MTVIAEFLTSKFKGGRAPSTIGGYRMAITRTLDHFNEMNLANNPQLSALIASFEIYHTSRLPKTVDWDTSVVLNALAKPPFEPLASALIKLLAWKTAILVMLASAR